VAAAAFASLLIALLSRLNSADDVNRRVAAAFEDEEVMEG
jgi:hypothetical protein